MSKGTAGSVAVDYLQAGARQGAKLFVPDAPVQVSSAHIVNTITLKSRYGDGAQ